MFGFEDMFMPMEKEIDGQKWVLLKMVKPHLYLACKDGSEFPAEVFLVKDFEAEKEYEESQEELKEEVK